MQEREIEAVFIVLVGLRGVGMEMRSGGFGVLAVSAGRFDLYVTVYNGTIKSRKDGQGGTEQSKQNILNHKQ